ncbi:hypothetical protein OPV22_026917 [Ensete ventricosum]|uniref:Uncharacterized protein n=1 Tax=Ensete ventricosum TaxID=4639 RepID=A0AAV8PYG9_ENSVE|nr:hypothetical protein OPV22_026917 [Ensete ventricosum]
MRGRIALFRHCSTSRRTQMRLALQDGGLKRSPCSQTLNKECLAATQEQYNCNYSKRRVVLDPMLKLSPLGSFCASKVFLCEQGTDWAAHHRLSGTVFVSCHLNCFGTQDPRLSMMLMEVIYSKAKMVKRLIGGGCQGYDLWQTRS